MPEPGNSIATFAISSTCTLPALAERFEDEIPRYIRPPEDIDEHLIPIGSSFTSYSFDGEFTRNELRTTL